MVFAKFLEKNCRKGRFCQSKLRGKRVIELGAGCGVAGCGMAILGCDVVSTDQKEVLPLLQRNLERNASRIMQMNPGSDSFGSIKAMELDWGNKDHIQAVCPPYDYIIGTDVVYAEHLLEPLLQTILALSGPRTTIMLGYEIRSTNVHERMLQMWKSSFDVKIVPKSKMDRNYQHPSIQLFMMEAKPSLESTREGIRGNDQLDDNDKKESEGTTQENSGGVDKVDDLGTIKGEGDCLLHTCLPSGELSDWEVRRYGAMAARLLRDVKIN
ncbi:hypothetical protein Ancab_012905 [Ancistrocladus abbreviatus]